METELKRIVKLFSSNPSFDGSGKWGADGRKWPVQGSYS